MDNIPVVVSNSCLKKKKIQELICDADKLSSVSLASERIENQLKANPNEEDLLKEYLLHGRGGADCSRYVSTYILSHTHIFLSNETGGKMRFWVTQKFVRDQKH